MAFVHRVAKGFFPLDEELQLLPGILTPPGHECLVRLAGWVPFDKASELFEELLEISVSKSISQRYTEGAGAAYVSLQTAEVEHLEQEMPAPPAGADKIQLSADGALVPLRHGQWAEVRTLVIGAVQPPVQERGEWVVHTRKLSYFSRKTSAEAFTRLALVATQRRGVENAKQVGAVMDGSDWLQGFTEHHRPDALRILDFPHAGEHLSQIGEFLWGEGTPKMKEWIEPRLHQLKHEGPAGLLAELHDLQTRHPAEKAVVGNLAYLEKRVDQMQYPQFQAQGWPIGSGIVESGNKLVVEARLKGSGMHWAAELVDPMLAICNILCSDRWKVEWPKVATKLRQQSAQKRSQLQQARAAAKVPLQPNIPAQSLPAVEDSPSQILIKLKRFEPPKKSANNPWRKFSYGKALYLPPDPPKN